jgi:hypothetical protein
MLSQRAEVVGDFHRLEVRQSHFRHGVSWKHPFRVFYPLGQHAGRIGKKTGDHLLPADIAKLGAYAPDGNCDPGNHMTGRAVAGNQCLRGLLARELQAVKSTATMSVMGPRTRLSPRILATC